MASSWFDLLVTSHYQEEPCACPAHHLLPRAGLESTESACQERDPPGAYPASTSASTRLSICVRRCRGCSPWGRSRRPSNCWPGCRIDGCSAAAVNHLVRKGKWDRHAASKTATASAC